MDKLYVPDETFEFLFEAKRYDSFLARLCLKNLKKIVFEQIKSNLIIKWLICILKPSEL